AFKFPAALVRPGGPRIRWVRLQEKRTAAARRVRSRPSPVAIRDGPLRGLPVAARAGHRFPLRTPEPLADVRTPARQHRRAVTTTALTYSVDQQLAWQRRLRRVGTAALATGVLACGVL